MVLQGVLEVPDAGVGFGIVDVEGVYCCDDLEYEKEGTCFDSVASELLDVLCRGEVANPEGVFERVGIDTVAVLVGK